MDRNIILQRTTSSAFLEAVERARADNLGRVQQNYLLCKAVLTARRKELPLLNDSGLDTTKLERMIMRLEASQAAHLRLIRKLETR